MFSPQRALSLEGTEPQKPCAFHRDGAGRFGEFPDSDVVRREDLPQ